MLGSAYHGLMRCNCLPLCACSHEGLQRQHLAHVSAAAPACHDRLLHMSLPWQLLVVAGWANKAATACLACCMPMCCLRREVWPPLIRLLRAAPA